MTLDHDGRVELTIAQVSKRDGGTYSCVATNEVGKTESFAVLKVLPKDEGVAPIADNHVEATERQEVPREIP